MWLSEIQGLSRCADKLDSYRRMTFAQAERQNKKEIIADCIDSGIDRVAEIAEELAIDANFAGKLLREMVEEGSIRAVMLNKQSKRYERNGHGN